MTTNFLNVNVNAYTESKGGLTYLSWAYAWAEVLKVDPSARYTVHEFDGLPLVYLKDETAMVKVSVEIAGVIKTCMLPVMDNRNRAIKNPDAFATNTAIQRCLTKCISLWGLGLYLYQGTDLPEGEREGLHAELDAKLAACQSTDDLTALFKSLPEALRREVTDKFSQRKKELTHA